MPKKVVKKINPVKNPSNPTKNNPTENIKKIIPIKKEVAKKLDKKSVTTPLKKTTKENIFSPLNLEKTLVENFVGLQKVMTNLAIKLDGLSNQISRLLNLFEISAKTLAEKGSAQQIGINEKRILEKIDNLVDQNRTIARGVSLLHENPSQQSSAPRQQPQKVQAIQKNFGESNNQYQRSISSRQAPFNTTQEI